MTTPRIDLGLTPPVRLGRLTLQPAVRMIRRDDGAEEVVEPRVMQVLIALVEARGDIVRRDDLTERCWEGRVVGEDAINRVLSRLRRVAEGIGADSFRIETITKIGYRLVELGDRAGGLPGASSSDSPSPQTEPLQRTSSGVSRRAKILTAALVLLLMAGAAGWWLFRPAPAAHSMMVSLSGFRTLSADLPPTMRETINAEISAAFNVDGVIGVAAEPASPSGTAPAYSLGGTIYRVGDSIRVITRFTNERSGVVLWSDSADYAADQIAKVPHKIAVDAGTVVRCGLSGAATYQKLLPDAVLSNYMQYCQEYWSYGGSKTLHFAQRVVAALPDFSWGWSAVANGYLQTSHAERDPRRAAALLAAGREAEDKAIALDRTNSEALAHKAYMIDPRDWLAQEALFKSAIAAKPLDCGCEHYGYGLKLESVGRLSAAIEQFRAATDMLALWPDSQIALARAYLAADRGEQAKPYFAAAADLSRDANYDKMVAVSQGVETGDYAAAIAALRNPQYQLPDATRAALLAGYEALTSGDAAAKAKAVQGLLALPKDAPGEVGEIGEAVTTMLGALGATREALQAASDKPWLFWRRSMRGALNEPSFSAVANQLGLVTYWKTTRTKPDICRSGSAPGFCRMI